MAVGFWVLEAYLDTVFIANASFWPRLFPSDPNELWMRGLVSALLIGFGLYAQKAKTRILRAESLTMDAAGFLKKALSTTIMGTYPICDSCKSIRIHKNIWIPPERFIAVQSKAEFTRSLCRHCQSEHPHCHAATGQPDA